MSNELTTTIKDNTVTDLATFFSVPPQEATFDLSKATLIECTQAKIALRQKISPNCHKQYFSVLKVLKNMESVFHCVIYPLQINEIFWSLFIPYLQNTKSPNSIRTICAQIKAVVEWSSHYGAVISPSYNMCKMPKVNKHHIALTPDDISRIYHFDINSIPRRKQYRRHMEKVRDMFCLMCNIGLRYSDARRPCPTHFNDEDMINILQEKTEAYAQINVLEMCIHKQMTLAILNKYNFNAPYSKDLTGFDKSLHDLMNYCNFADIITQETITDGRIATVDRVKYNMITSHTARRTFVVNNALRGKNYLQIMRATGHKTFDAFQKYLCYD